MQKQKNIEFLRFEHHGDGRLVGQRQRRPCFDYFFDLDASHDEQVAVQDVLIFLDGDQAFIEPFVGVRDGHSQKQRLVVVIDDFDAVLAEGIAMLLGGIERHVSVCYY